jgi:hypothetical protein
VYCDILPSDWFKSVRLLFSHYKEISTIVIDDAKKFMPIDNGSATFANVLEEEMFPFIPLDSYYYRGHVIFNAANSHSIYYTQSNLARVRALKLAGQPSSSFDISEIESHPLYEKIEIERKFEYVVGTCPDDSATSSAFGAGQQYPLPSKWFTLTEERYAKLLDDAMSQLVTVWMKFGDRVEKLGLTFGFTKDLTLFDIADGWNTLLSDPFPGAAFVPKINNLGEFYVLESSMEEWQRAEERRKIEGERGAVEDRVLYSVTFREFLIKAVGLLLDWKLMKESLSSMKVKLTKLKASLESVIEPSLSGDYLVDRTKRWASEKQEIPSRGRERRGEEEEREGGEEKITLQVSQLNEMLTQYVDSFDPAMIAAFEFQMETLSQTLSPDYAEYQTVIENYQEFLGRGPGSMEKKAESLGFVPLSFRMLNGVQTFNLGQILFLCHEFATRLMALKGTEELIRKQSVKMQKLTLDLFNDAYGRIVLKPLSGGPIEMDLYMIAKFRAMLFQMGIVLKQISQPIATGNSDLYMSKVRARVANLVANPKDAALWIKFNDLISKTTISRLKVDPWLQVKILSITFQISKSSDEWKLFSQAFTRIEKNMSTDAMQVLMSQYIARVNAMKLSESQAAFIQEEVRQFYTALANAGNSKAAFNIMKTLFTKRLTPIFARLAMRNQEGNIQAKGLDLNLVKASTLMPEDVVKHQESLLQSGVLVAAKKYLGPSRISSKEKTTQRSVTVKRIGS